MKEEIEISGIIGLEGKYRKLDSVSGFDSMAVYGENNNIPAYLVDSYSLTDPADIEKVSALDIDILLVVGWQRLVPEWLIKHVKIACVGAHGSPWGIGGGRGRSPINWSLILGKRSFIINIFKINAGIDAGEIIDQRELGISEFDDVNSIYFKVSWFVSQMIVQNIKNGKIQKGDFEKQPETAIRYLPQRMPEDGEIDWDRTSRDVYNFVRALTKPYPGAFSDLGDTRVFLFKTIPVENIVGFERYVPGQIIKFYETQNKILVKCRDSAVLIEEYETESNMTASCERKIFKSANWKEQIQNILNRHYLRYPKNNCNEEIEKIVESGNRGC